MIKQITRTTRPPYCTVVPPASTMFETIVAETALDILEGRGWLSFLPPPPQIKARVIRREYKETLEIIYIEISAQDWAAVSKWVTATDAGPADTTFIGGTKWHVWK